ncbi:hypothetical protein QLH51_12645 [Sphingomonas sp. 2R-10]|nr:hypothetical protein [Sphingomonas sp. 2R-10]
MSVLDLAIFLRIHRSGRGTSAGEVAQTISHWFQCHIDPHEVEQSFPRMAEAGWLVRRETGMRATIKGRKHGRSHLRGIVRMLDQGTRMLDVAAMMSVLKLAMIELDGEHDDDDDQG